ncbi:hypothetical protein BURPS668_A0326 [Burkholderia pseudomallei 668]|nr:hypothetical protein BURPS668_A0326 [Burkholderia pseudomallei 668]
MRPARRRRRRVRAQGMRMPPGRSKSSGVMVWGKAACITIDGAAVARAP